MFISNRSRWFTSNIDCRVVYQIESQREDIPCRQCSFVFLPVLHRWLVVEYSARSYTSEQRENGWWRCQVTRRLTEPFSDLADRRVSFCHFPSPSLWLHELDRCFLIWLRQSLWSFVVDLLELGTGCQDRFRQGRIHQVRRQRMLYDSIVIDWPEQHTRAIEGKAREISRITL